MNRTLLLLLSLLLASTAQSQPGAAYYGLQHPSWPCSRSLKALPKINPKIAIVWNSFGTDNACLEKFLRRPGRKTLEIHLKNECCIRNRDCADYELFNQISTAEYERKIVEQDPVFRAEWLVYAARAAEVVLQYRKGLICQISPGLESNLSNEAGAVLISWLKPLFPTCKFVWSGMHPGQPGNAQIKEWHGMDGAERGGACIWDNDGLDLNLAARPGFFHLGSIDIERFAAAKTGCEKYYWISEFNGRGRHEPQLHPRGRVNWPTAGMLAEVGAFLQ